MPIASLDAGSREPATPRGWQFAALASGKAAGLEVDPLTILRLTRFLDSVPADGGAAYGHQAP
jgi:hypothetical protein